MNSHQGSDQPACLLFVYCEASIGSRLFLRETWMASVIPNRCIGSSVSLVWQHKEIFSFIVSAVVDDVLFFATIKNGIWKSLGKNVWTESGEMRND